VISPYRRQALSRKRIRKARELAPKHPPGPEARIRRAIAKVLNEYHNEIRAALLAYASRKSLRWFDAEPHLAAIFEDLLKRARKRLTGDEFAQVIRDAAQLTSESARRQVAKALGLDSVPADLKSQIQELIDASYRLVDERLNDSLDRAQDVFDQWRDGEEQDLDTLDTKLDDGLGGILGGALAGAALVYGAIWSDMNQDAQESAGVTEYVWVAQRDTVTRPEHRALDNALANWNEPPLSASESSSGEACHPGEDYNCRCVAAPLN